MTSVPPSFSASHSREWVSDHFSFLCVGIGNIHTETALGGHFTKWRIRPTLGWVLPLVLLTRCAYKSPGHLKNADSVLQ